MSNRDQVIGMAEGSDLQSEVVTVPEWGDLKFVVRELNARDRNTHLDSYTRQVEDADGDLHVVPVEDPLRQARLVILSTFEEDGSRTFLDEDAETLGKRGASALDRLSKAAVRLSGLNPAAVDDAGKASEAVPTDGSSSD